LNKLSKDILAGIIATNSEIKLGLKGKEFVFEN